MKRDRLGTLMGRVLVIVCLLLLPGAAPVAAVQSSSAPPSQSKSQAADAGVDIVVQGALDSELGPLLAALEEKEQIQIAAWTFWRGRIGGKIVVVSRTEVGPINASVATTLAIINFRPQLIINQGTAGANDPELKVFDIVIGESTVDYGAFISEHADAGQGADISRLSPLYHRLRLDGKDRLQFKSFPGDEEAMRVALRTPYKRSRLVKGVIGSAFQFNKEIDRLLWVKKTYGNLSEDMESVFSAGAAQGFKTRFLAIRIISDSEFYAPEIRQEAGEYCAAFVVDVIKGMK